MMTFIALFECFCLVRIFPKQGQCCEGFLETIFGRNWVKCKMWDVFSKFDLYEHCWLSI